MTTTSPGTAAMRVTATASLTAPNMTGSVCRSLDSASAFAVATPPVAAGDDPRDVRPQTVQSEPDEVPDPGRRVLRVEEIGAFHAALRGQEHRVVDQRDGSGQCLSGEAQRDPLFGADRLDEVQGQ